MSNPHRATGTARGRAGGLGSSRRGVDAWRSERVTAIALLPLTLWLVASLVALGVPSRASFIAWLGRPLPAFLMSLLLILVFRHLALGLQVIIEDYIHSAAKIALLIAAHLGCLALCVAGVLATLSIALGR